MTQASPMTETNSPAQLLKKHVVPTKQTAKLVATVACFSLICTGLVFLLLCFVISLVLGGLWNPFPYAKVLDVVIINNDNGVVGSFMQNNFTNYSPYGVRVDNSITDVAGYIGDARAWFALYIPSGYSDNLMGALNGSVTTYDQQIQMYVDEGRSYLVLAILEPLLTESVKGASDVLMMQILSTATLSNVKAMNVLLNPMAVKTNVVHPNTYFGQDIATGFLNVFIFILSVVITLLTGNTYMMGLFGKVNFVSFYLIRQAHNLFNAIVLAATVTVGILCWSPPFYLSPGLYFLFYVLVILTVIQVIDVATLILRQYTILFALAFLVLNFSTSTALIMFEIQHPFFQFGYGLLMYNVVNGARFIMFGSDNRMGQYVGVIVAWLVCCWTLALFLYIMNVIVVIRKKKALERKKEIDKEKDATAGGVVTQTIRDVEDKLDQELENQNVTQDQRADLERDHESE